MGRAHPIKFSDADFYDNGRLIANCGPGALAAIAGLHLRDLMRDIPDFQETGGLSFERMQSELSRIGLKWRLHTDELPSHGVAILAWMERDTDGEQIPRHTKYTHANQRHWIASADGGRLVFDPFAANSGWLPLNQWKQRVLSALTGYCDFEFPICRIAKSLSIEGANA